MRPTRNSRAIEMTNDTKTAQNNKYFLNGVPTVKTWSMACLIIHCSRDIGRLLAVRNIFHIAWWCIWRINESLRVQLFQEKCYRILYNWDDSTNKLNEVLFELRKDTRKEASKDIIGVGLSGKIQKKNAQRAWASGNFPSATKCIRTEANENQKRREKKGGKDFI